MCGVSSQYDVSTGRVADSGLRDCEVSGRLYAATRMTEPGGDGLGMDLISSLWYFFANAGSRNVLLS